MKKALLVFAAAAFVSCTVDEGLDSPGPSYVTGKVNRAFCYNLLDFPAQILHEALLLDDYMAASPNEKKESRFAYIDHNFVQKGDTVYLDKTYITGNRSVREKGAKWKIQVTKQSWSKQQTVVFKYVAGKDSLWSVSTLAKPSNKALIGDLSSMSYTPDGFDNGKDEDQILHRASMRMLKSSDNATYPSFMCTATETGSIWKDKKYETGSADGVVYRWKLKTSPSSTSVSGIKNGKMTTKIFDSQGVEIGSVTDYFDNDPIVEPY